MFKYVYSVALTGIDGVLIRVETDVRDGLPSFGMVGYVSTQVKEAGERVRSALHNSGFELRPKKILVNLSPASVKKEGTAFDLPIAVAIFSSIMDISQELLDNVAFAGELCLDGKVNKTRGILPICCVAKENKIDTCFVPEDNYYEAKAVNGLHIIGVSCFGEIADYLISGGQKLPCRDREPLLQQSEHAKEPDFADVFGQESVKRAIKIAVSGFHNILMIGNAGSGKSMLAKRIPGIMPELTDEESLEISKIYSISGMLDGKNGLMRKRPFRAPHHMATASALTGGGVNPRTGEISLAHRGVLFLDELPEFKSEALETLREPMEDKSITIARVHANVTYPADFLTVAAMNPCKCGYYPDRSKCRCTEAQVRKYLQRVSRPIWDRFDIIAMTEPSEFENISRYRQEEDSASIRKRVEITRAIQLERFKNEDILFNSQMSTNQIEKYCVLGREERDVLKEAFESLNLSARAYHKILKTARTIADMNESDMIGVRHLSEAIHYRSMIKLFDL